jgi:hypothetical protein
MNNEHTTSGIIKLALACAIFSSFSFVSALTISPARLEVSADPGIISQGEFTVVNEQDADQVFYTSVENFEAQGETGTPNFTPSKEGLASWIHTAESVTLKKGEKAKIPFTIEVPKDADAGGHFAAIFLSTVPPSSKDGGQVSVGAKIGMLILLRVSGNIKEQGGVLSFALKNGSKVSTMLPVDFVYRFKNDGADRVKPVGSVSIKNMFGLEAAKLNANPTEGNILPSSIRRYENTWGQEAPLPASSSFFTFVKYEYRNFALGFYFADLDLTFGVSSEAHNSLWFVVFPWHLLVVVAILLLILFVILRLALHHYNNFIIAQARLANGGQAASHASRKRAKK